MSYCYVMVLFSILCKSFLKKCFWEFYLLNVITYAHTTSFFPVEKAEKLVSVIRVKRCVVQKDTQKMGNT